MIIKVLVQKNLPKLSIKIFIGVLQCDGYSGYNSLENSNTRVGWWVHVYRKFYENVTRIGGQFEYLQDILEKISQLP
ncbi:IS66 family transposase, partial [Ligilactobacillus sp. WILCCON 0076]